MPRKISAPVREQVRQRAAFLCEYCHTDEHWQLVPFTVDHILPASEGGSDTLENLALACFHCNRHKSDKQTVFDAITEKEILLFNLMKSMTASFFPPKLKRLLKNDDAGR